MRKHKISSCRSMQVTWLVPMVLALGLVTPALWASPNPNAEVNDLLEMSLEDLMNLEVSSATLTKVTKQTVPTAMTLITQEQIRDCGARNLFELLDIFVPNFQWGLRFFEPKVMGIRGINSQFNDKMLLQVNGRTLNEKTEFGAFSENDLPMMGDIDHIEIIRGGGSALHGPGALAMVVNIVTENAETFEGEEVYTRLGAVYQMGQLEYKRGRRLSDDQNYYIYAGIAQVDGAHVEDSQVFLGSARTYDGVSYNNTHVYSTYFNNEGLNFNRGPSVKLYSELNKGGAKVWFRYTQGGQTTIEPLNPNQAIGYQQTTLYGSYLQRLAPEASIEYVVSYDRHNTRSDTWQGWHYLEEEFFLRMLGQWEINDQHSVALGAEWSHDMFGRDEGGSWWYRMDWQGIDMKPWNTDLSSVFGEYQWKICNAWTLFLSGRWDYHSMLGSMYSPKGILVFTPTENDAIKFITSKSVRTNSAGIMKLNQINGVENDIEKLKATELRYERTLNDKLSAAIAGFYHDHYVIGWSVSKGAITGLGDFRSWGAELEISYRSDRTRIDFSHGYTKLLKNWELMPGINSQELTAAPMGYGEDFASWSNHVTKLAVHYQLNPKWSVDGSANVYWGFPGGKDWAEYNYANDNNVYPWGYTKSFDTSVFVHLGAGYQYSEQTSFQLTGYNLAGLFDKYLNGRRSLFNPALPAMYRMHAPSVTLSMSHKF